MPWAHGDGVGVGPSHLQRRGPHAAQQRRGDGDHQRDHRQGEVGQHRAQRHHVAGDQRVDDARAGDHPQSGVTVDPAARGRRPAEGGVEHEDQQQADPEVGEGVAEQAAHPDGVIAGPVDPHRRPDAEGQGQDQGDGDGEDHQLEGRPEAVEHLVADRPPGLDRRAEVAAHAGRRGSASTAPAAARRGRSARRAASISSGVAVGPRIVAIGSPGSTRMSTNVSAVTPSSVGTSRSRRRTE